MDLGLHDQVFVITAASAGLGKATADQLIAEGARVILVARREAELARIVAEYGPGRAAFVAGDLADPEASERAAALAIETFGRLDGALVSVGGPPRGRVLDNSDTEWRDAFDSVFLAGLRVVRAVVGTAPGPVALALVLSTSVKSPLPTMAISNGLRPGLGMLVKQLADELGPDGSRVLGLMPGMVMTERLTWLLEREDPALVERRMDGVPLRRAAQPEEFGRVAAFLLSPAASYLTGSMIAIDGGALRAL